jgi:hypothetical protein
MIAFYYAFTGIACALYYRHELTKSVKSFFFIRVGPVVGSLILGYLFYASTAAARRSAWRSRSCSAWVCCCWASS